MSVLIITCLSHLCYPYMKDGWALNKLISQAVDAGGPKRV